MLERWHFDVTSQHQSEAGEINPCFGGNSSIVAQPLASNVVSRRLLSNCPWMWVWVCGNWVWTPRCVSHFQQFGTMCPCRIKVIPISGEWHQPVVVADHRRVCNANCHLRFLAFCINDSWIMRFTRYRLILRSIIFVRQRCSVVPIILLLHTNPLQPRLLLLPARST